jgi:hypothetical protein
MDLPVGTYNPTRLSGGCFLSRQNCRIPPSPSFPAYVKNKTGIERKGLSAKDLHIIAKINRGTMSLWPDYCFNEGREL